MKLQGDKQKPVAHSRYKRETPENFFLFLDSILFFSLSLCILFVSVCKEQA